MAKAEQAKSEGGLQIGVAAADITPPIGVTLMGYGPRTSKGVGHRLRAQALACKNGEAAWLLVTSDVIGYDSTLVGTLRQKIAKATGIKAHSIMISGTHTHSGPLTIPYRFKELAAIDRDYLEELPERMAEMAAAACKGAKAGTFEVAWGEAPALGSNRRIRQADGKVVNQWEDDFGTHGGYFDPTILLVGVRRPGVEGREALLVNYGVHPVTLGPQSLKISADYVGYMRDALEARGTAGTVMFAIAGAANINPRTCIKVGAEYPRRMGEALAEIVAEAAIKLTPVAGTRVIAHREPWQFARARDETKGPGKKGEKVETEVQVLRAGDLALVSIPGELVNEFNRTFREASPFPHTVIVSLANDYLGYLCTDAIMAEGAYEAGMAPTEGVEKMLTEHVHKALAAVADQAV